VLKSAIELFTAESSYPAFQLGPANAVSCSQFAQQTHIATVYRSLTVL